MTLFMPPHSSHLLQPLDVGLFGPLKQAYSREIEGLVASHIFHITKLEWLSAFRSALNRVFTVQNILGGFRGAGLMPWNPEIVISKLDLIF